MRTSMAALAITATSPMASSSMSSPSYCLHRGLADRSVALTRSMFTLSGF